MPKSPRLGGAQPDYLYPVPAYGSSSVAWPSANQGIFVKFRVDRATIATGLLVENGGTVAGNRRAGLYSSDGTTLTQLAMSASTAGSGAGTTQAIPFAANAGVVPFLDYYWFLANDNATDTFPRVLFATMTSRPSRIGYALASALPTPPTTQAISGMSAGLTYCPIVAVITTG